MEAGEPADLQPFTSLPGEVIFKILNKLSVRTLLRCRCVCKDWNSFLTSQSFINAHLLSHPHRHGLLFSHVFEPSVPSSSTSEETQLCSFFADETFSLVHKFKVPLPYGSGQRSGRFLVGSINGLVCLTDWEPFGRKLYLWNPTIRRYKTVSSTCFEIKHHPRFPPQLKNVALGLGFRKDTSDYIIIRIDLFKWGTQTSESNHLHQAEAYSMSTDSWNEVGISEDVSRRLKSIRSRSCGPDGYLNWIAMFSDREGRHYDSILSFDVNKKEFRETRLPNDCRNGIDVRNLTIAIHRGLLAIVLYGTPIPEDGNWYVWLWTMEDYGKVDSWRRTTVKTTGARALVGCTLDGRIIFERGGIGNTVIELLDMETLQEQQFTILDFLSVHAFKETLVYLKGANVSSE